MASKLYFTIAVCSCPTLAKVNAIFAGVGNLGFRRTRRTKTVLRIPAMQFVAENKMRTAILAKSSRPGKKLKFVLETKSSTLVRRATRIIRRTKTLRAKRPIFRVIATNIGTTQKQLVSGLVGFYGTKRQSVHP